jgi:hypothetical protein
VLEGADWAGQPERRLGGVTLAAGVPRWRWDPRAGHLVGDGTRSGEALAP